MKTFPNLIYDPAFPTGLLDLYTPNHISNAPLVVYVHGGGWEHGDKFVVSVQDPMLTAFDALIAAGFCVASVNYRLAPVYQFPAMVQDVKAAIRWLKLHAGTYGFSASRLVSWGSSAGGLMTNLCGQSGTPASWETAVNPGADSTVAAVVDWFGPYDLDSMPNPPPPPADPNTYVNVFGQPPYAWASPIAYVGPASKPTLIQHGALDTLCPPDQAQRFNDALVAAGVSCQLQLVANASHDFQPSPAGAIISPSLAALATQVVSFLQAHV